MIIYSQKNPARFMLSGFLFIILWGTFVLLLPHSTVAGHIPFIDALFTATSAVCVTGLTTVDIGTTFTLLGQVTILVLIQLGGIGVAFFGILFGLVFTGRINVGQKSLFSSTMTPRAQWDIWGVFRVIFLVTITVELIGAVIIAIPMMEVVGGDPFRAFYHGLFHSVSAFCNAGFALMPDNFVSFRGEPLVIIPVMCLIVIGGIGFFVIDELLQMIRSRRRHRPQPPLEDRADHDGPAYRRRRRRHRFLRVPQHLCRGEDGAAGHGQPF